MSKKKPTGMRKDGLVGFEIDLMVNAKLGATWREEKRNIILLVGALGNKKRWEKLDQAVSRKSIIFYFTFISQIKH